MARTSAVYQRRNELARERGFASYADQRRQFEYAKQSESWVYGQTSYVNTYGEPRANRPGDAARVRLFYDAFKREPDNYRADGPKARWFIQVEGMMSYDDWIERYPTGTR